jgi:hypothetical protein
VEFLQPHSVGEALQAKRAPSRGVPISSGTALMVELNSDRGRPQHVHAGRSAAPYVPDNEVDVAESPGLPGSAARHHP